MYQAIHLVFTKRFFIPYEREKNMKKIVFKAKVKQYGLEKAHMPVFKRVYCERVVKDRRKEMSKRACRIQSRF